MSHSSILINTPCELINLTPLNPLISRCQIKVCYVGDKPNRNGSVITKDVAREMANSLPGSPIVGFYNENTGDFEEHNRRIEISGGVLKFEDTTRPYGFVDLNAKVWFQDYLDDGVVHTYMVTEGYLWTGQYPEAKRIIERGNNQSMELDENSLDGSWTISDKDGMEFFIINEAVISKLCILGEDFEPCFEGANITHFSLDDNFNEKIYRLMKEVKNLKGGNSLMDNENVSVVTTEEEVVVNEEDVVEEVVVTDELAPGAEEQPEIQEELENNPVQEYSAAEQTEEEEVVEEEEEDDAAEENNDENQGENVSFNLDDFQTLQNNYSELENRFNDLTNRFNAMEAEYNTLVEFKKTKDIEEKQAMIDSFYMLSAEDKEDVQNNIEAYSIDDIKAKLSIICVDHKLNLSEDANQQVTETTYSFSDDTNEDDLQVPGWLKALRKTKEKEN